MTTKELAIAASTIWDAQGSQPFSGSGGRPMWFRTMLRSGIRRAVSSTVSICSCVLVIASNTSFPLKNLSSDSCTAGCSSQRGSFS